MMRATFCLFLPAAEDPDNVLPVGFDGASLAGSTLTVDLPSRSVVALELR